MEATKTILNTDMHSKLQLVSEILTRLRKDMLAMEEELRAFKTQAMIKERWDEIKQEDENKRLKYKYGTAVADNNVPEPNKEKQPIIIKYTWHR